MKTDEERRVYAREWYHKNKNKPYYQYNPSNLLRKKQRNDAALARYHRDPDKYRAYNRSRYVKKHKAPQGIPGSVRYEARVAGFRSGFERTIDIQLKISKVKYAYEDTKIPYVLECEYHPDFHLLNSGIFVETKGVLSVEDRRKHLALKKQRPDLDIRFVFMRADEKIPRMKCTHAEWATRNGFKYGDGRIPEEWLDE